MSTSGTRRWMSLVTAAGLLLVAACGSDDDGGADTTAASPAETAATTTETTAAAIPRKLSRTQSTTNASAATVWSASRASSVTAVIATAATATTACPGHRRATDNTVRIVRAGVEARRGAHPPVSCGAAVRRGLGAVDRDAVQGGGRRVLREATRLAYP